MKNHFTQLLLSCALCLALPATADVVVVGNANLPKLDAETLNKIYTGRVIQVGGVSVVPVNLKPGNKLRGQFLSELLNSDDERYIAYWTVRRYIGKGAPPRELASSAEVIAHVQHTPGAIGYIDAADLKPDLKPALHVLLRR